MINVYEQILSGIDSRISMAAKLRALYPVIEKNIAAGLSYQIILADLKEAGLIINYELFRKTLFRIRKKNKTAKSIINQASKTENAVMSLTTPTLAPTTTLAPASNTDDTKQPERQPISSVNTPSKRIESPADLRAIRDMEVDLNALKEEWKAQNRQKK